MHMLYTVSFSFHSLLRKTLILPFMNEETGAQKCESVCPPYTVNTWEDRFQPSSVQFFPPQCAEFEFNVIAL